MKYSKLGTILGAIVGVLTLSVGSGGLASLVSAQSTTEMSHTMQANQIPQRYRVNLRPLNSSGVHGVADILLNGRALTVSVRASGLTPNMIHAQHIHGQNSEQGPAECPTVAQDTNMDNFISVTEGAPSYGPIKLNLTNPQTPFGPNNTTINDVKLFTPFAGVPVFENFPKADANGNISFTNTYLFDTNNAAANAAFQTLNPLTDQEVVLHGAVAPKDVETAAGGGTTMAYDGLLPVACARITAVGRQHQPENGDQGQGSTGESSSISNTGPGSTNSINTNTRSSKQSTNHNTVNVDNQNNQTAHSGSTTSSGNTNANGGFGSRANSFHLLNWSDMNPTTWQANGRSFSDWWSHMNRHMTQHNANHWTLGSAANDNWASSSGSNWQNTWSNWDPALWQANGQSYGNWFGQMLEHMTGNYSHWMQNWNGSANSGVSTGSANNSNNTEATVTVEN